jgi:DNA-binding response OmpR family regulator
MCGTFYDRSRTSTSCSSKTTPASPSSRPRISRRTGCAFRSKARGDRALERFAQERPRLVLLDLLLPARMACHLPRTAACHEVPILILTARDTDFDHVIGSKPAPTIT